jgi:arylsulfatase A-like enzyme
LFRHRWPAVLAAAVFLGFVDVGLALRARPHELRQFTAALSPLAVTVGVAFLACWMLARLVPDRWIRRLESVSPRMAVWWSAVPVLSGELVLLAWCLIYPLRDAETVGRWLAVAGGLASVSVTLVAFDRLRATRLHRLAPAVLALGVVIGAIAVGRGPASGSGLDAPSARARPVRHVVLITIDSLRADHVGSDRARTPNIDRLAADGVRFLHAVSPSPWTKPSFATVMTGLDPAVHRVFRDGDRLPRQMPTLAERMHQSGYRTAAFVRNVYLMPRFGLARGFDLYRVASRAGYVGVPSAGGYLLGAVSLIRDAGTSALGLFREPRALWTPLLARLSTEWIRENREEDFFLWVHFLDPHLPYAPPASYLADGAPPAGMGPRFDELLAVRSGRLQLSPDARHWVERLYAAEVAFVDDHVGMILDTLRELGLYDRALIVLTSDHGEELWDHGGFEHGHTLYEELLHVPLILKLPGSTTRVEVDRTASIRDLAATILDVCDLPPGSPSETGVPLWDVLDSEPPSSSEDRPIYLAGVRGHRDRAGITFEQHKYLSFPGEQREELYDLRRDPQERVSLVGEAPQLTRRGRNLLMLHQTRAVRERQRLGLSSDELELDRRTIDALRSLGYLD